MTTLIGYERRLPEQMSAAGIFSTSKLIPLLQYRGVHLSPRWQEYASRPT